MTTPPSLLIWHPGALGDLVSIFPLIKSLRRRFHPLAILCQAALGRLAAAECLVDSWHPIEAGWTASLFAGEPATKARRILSEFASILVFSNSDSLAASLREITGGRIYRLPPRPPVDQRIHVADYVSAQLSSWGLIPAGQGRAADDQDDTVAPLRAGEPHGWMLHPGAGSPRKRWPIEGFLEVAERLRRRGELPRFIVGPAEEALLAPIKKKGLNFHCPANGIELLALLRSASAYIGNDSGVSHLAAWAGLGSVVIFGPTDPLRWAPRGRRVQVVQPPLDCRPCFETASENCAAAGCLSRITPDDILDACLRVYRAC